MLFFSVETLTTSLEHSKIFEKALATLNNNPIDFLIKQQITDNTLYIKDIWSRRYIEVMYNYMYTLSNNVLE